MQTVKRRSLFNSLRYALAALGCTTGPQRKASIQTTGNLNQNEHGVALITDLSFEIVKYFLAPFLILTPFNYRCSDSCYNNWKLSKNKDTDCTQTWSLIIPSFEDIPLQCRAALFFFFPKKYRMQYITSQFNEVSNLEIPSSDQDHGQHYMNT